MQQSFMKTSKTKHHKQKTINLLNLLNFLNLWNIFTHLIIKLLLVITTAPQQEGAQQSFMKTSKTKHHKQKTLDLKR